jgi:hypothetical protein
MIDSTNSRFIYKTCKYCKSTQTAKQRFKIQGLRHMRLKCTIIYTKAVWNIKMYIGYNKTGNVHIT